MVWSLGQQFLSITIRSLSSDSRYPLEEQFRDKTLRSLGSLVSSSIQPKLVSMSISRYVWDRRKSGARYYFSRYAHLILLQLWAIIRFAWCIEQCKDSRPFLLYSFPVEFSCSPLVSFFWIGLSAGQISQVIVGDEQRQYLLVFGQDVDDVQLAQRLAQANEIVLSWNCWKLCEQYMFEVEIVKEDEAVKVGGWHYLLHVLKRPTTPGSPLVVVTYCLAKPTTIGTLFWREVVDTLPER